MPFERVIVYEAVCDEPGCVVVSEWFLPSRDTPRRADVARADARAQGWRVDADGTAYCPTHAATAETMEPT